MGHNKRAGYHRFNGGDCCGYIDNLEQLTADSAKALVDKYVSEKFKDYTTGIVTEHARPNGFKLFSVKVEDSIGNKFVFVVNPRGHVRGPILESDFEDIDFKFYR
jgi:hypothetical protein